MFVYKLAFVFVRSLNFVLFHCLCQQNEQKKLMMQNLWLADFARHYNIDVIDTFNITVARYKDFLQGKCACHFHKVGSDADVLPRVIIYMIITR